ncbi:MAG: hypothetical protein A2Y17_04280 [Clostridiales bacterium GWF2_38_85]|nr:MAG: hypothetical protein A2Y17_04280 [Clostridiales bacterium GWF2_38_85]HBL83431.1 hypothetical protein [Clostridiales bacterium]
MNDIIELKNLLSSMNKILSKLLEVENEKTAVLEKGSVEVLNTLINAEQALIMECSAAEKQRTKLCNRLEVQSVTELFEKIPEAENNIRPVYIDMFNIIKKIKKISGLNMKLLDTRLKIVKFMTSQLGVSEENQTYSKKAQIIN